MGYLRSRGTTRTAVIARECPWMIIKLPKFNSLITHCAIVPLNWMYCPPKDAQRLVINAYNNLTTTCHSCLKLTLVPNALAFEVSPNGIVTVLENVSSAFSPNFV